jgi:hypothetical protein
MAAVKEWRGNPETGEVATKRVKNVWGVMHPQNGGYWTASDDEVADWPQLVVKEGTE